MWDVNDPLPETDSVEYIARRYSLADARGLLLDAAYRTDERGNWALYHGFENRHETYVNCARQLIEAHYASGTVRTINHAPGPSPDTIRQAVLLWSIDAERDDLIPFGELWETYLDALTRSIAGFMSGDESHIANSLIIFMADPMDQSLRFAERGPS